MFSLEGRIAIVTGGASGIGRGISEVLSRAGAHVVIADIDVARGTSAAADIGGTFEPLDVTSQDQCRTVVADAVERFGQLDVLCSNTGVFPQASLADMTEQQWDQMQDVNLKGTFFMVQAALRPMRQRGYGRIVIHVLDHRVDDRIPWLVPLRSEQGRAARFHAERRARVRTGRCDNQCRPARERAHRGATGSG